MESKIISKKNIGDLVQTSIQLSNRDKSFITSGEIKKIVDKFETGGSKIVVRALNIERWMTLKGINEDFDDEALDDYYRNKVKEADVHKFITFPQVQITVFRKK
jgi:hypothetical protein